MDIKIGIIGAGIAGLSCGYELTKRKIDVTIFEKEDRVGGRLRTEEHGGSIVDVGALIFSPVIKPNFTKYFFEFGLQDEIDGPPLAPDKFGLKCGDKIIPLTKSAMTFSGLYSFSELRKMGKFEGYMKKLSFNYNQLSPELQKNHEISTVDFFKDRGFSSQFIDRFVQPFTGMYYVDPSLLSAALGLKMFASSNAPNFQPKSGMSIVARKIQERLGNKVVTGAHVTKVTQENGGFTVNYEHNGAVRNAAVDILVCATPLPVTKRLFPQLKNIRMDYSVACVLAVKGRLKEPFRKFRIVLVSRAQNPSNVFSLVMNKEDPEVAVVHLYQKPYDLSPYFEQGYEVMKEYEWSPAMVTPRPGAIFPKLDTDIDNLYICGDFHIYPTVGVEAATVSGQRVADMIYARSLPDPLEADIWRM